jgi:TatD DNase family protein
VSVACLSVDEILSGEIPMDYVTAGVHPWWAEDYTLLEIDNLKKAIEKLLAQGKIWGIGETGIDRGFPEILEQQKDLFSWHLELSERHHLPLVIHSVRAGSDFLQILKEKRPQSPWIFHDFRGNEELLKDLLRLHPGCYFSFGISIDNSPQVRELLPLVPLDKLFLETDDQKHLDIHDITLRAAHHLQMDLVSLKSKLWSNFRKISPISLQ